LATGEGLALMNEPNPDHLNPAPLTWADLTWQDIHAIGMALAERHPGAPILRLPDSELARMVAALPGFSGAAESAPRHLLSAIGDAWIEAVEGEDDSSPYEFLG
jgi:FeS assembly protein IscX